MVWNLDKDENGLNCVFSILSTFINSKSDRLFMLTGIFKHFFGWVSCYKKSSYHIEGIR